ncbi:MAG: sulfite reductase flavoprotein subunit alpha [Candidatus Methylacidiphilales bacterium]|nr:sulfite reductase subunit alpha [Candidatus Methylacidiphilales bacterium]
MSTPTPPAAASAYSRTNPFPAKLTENRALTKPGSNKDTRHLVVNIEGSGLSYVCGDSLAVYPRNRPEIVDSIIEMLQFDSQEIIPLQGGVQKTLRAALLENFALNRVNKKFVRLHVEKLPDGDFKDKLSIIIADETELENFAYTRDYVDVLIEFPGGKWTAPDFIATLIRGNPRLYSIASSPDAHPGEVHLTVAVVQYTTHNRKKFGLASGYLANNVPLNDPTVPVYITPTKHFHLPPGDTPLIMVGPGTGIAPFRAFLEQRLHNGDKGKNWLFFGDQRRSTDFLYEEEFEAWKASGHLTKLTTAFSRDQAEKIYVQHRMIQEGAELWQWLQEGAYFCVCGDAKNMAKDVNKALIEISMAHGGMTIEEATKYVDVTLSKTEKRYLKDVY